MEIKEIETLLAAGQNFLKAENLDSLVINFEKAQAQTFESGFWQKKDAQQQMQAISLQKNKIDQLNNFKNTLENLETALFLATENNTFINTNSDTSPEEISTQKYAKQLAAELKTLKTAAYLSGPYDQKGLLFSIHAGQGGTEAMDWASMLQRMYLRYFERRGWKYSLINESRGEDAGIKAVHYELAAATAPAAYGYLKHERGTHRLVRLSPFNADSLRQTSFALVEIMPLIEEDDQDIKIADSDLEWHYSRAGGPGGQNVNKVNSAVELYYKPLDLTVKCREERSQEQNKQRALKVLKAEIALRLETAQAAEMAAVKGEHIHASWGNQIRNYVLHPYHLVKDTRTGQETSDTEGVLDGDLDDFINAEIEQLTKRG